MSSSGFFQHSRLRLVLQHLLGRADASRHATLLWLLAIATEKQLPLVSALYALADESSGSRWKRSVEDLGAMIEDGTPLWQALGAVPDLLPAETLSTLQTAGRNGTLVSALRMEAQRISDSVEDSAGESPLAVIFYVSCVALIGAVIVGFLMVFVVPKFKAIFEDFGVDLPDSTIALIDSSGNFLVYFILPISFMLSGLLIWLTGQIFGFWSSPVPRLVSAFPRMAVGGVLRNLGLCVDAGKPLPQAIEAASDYQFSRRLHLQLESVRDAMRAGADCWESLCEEGLINRKELALLKSAERAGNLGWALKSVGKEVDACWRRRILRLVQLLKPAALLVVGLVVMFVTVAMFMPLIKLIRDLA